MSLSKVSLLSESDDLQEDMKIFKSDTFENYKSFVPVEVQSQYFISYLALFFNVFALCANAD